MTIDELIAELELASRRIGGRTRVTLSTTDEVNDGCEITSVFYSNDEYPICKLEID